MAWDQIDDYCMEANRQVLTYEQHGIRGVRTFGHSLNAQAASPLESHIHSGCLELVLLTEGSQSYTVGGESYPMARGDVFISFPGEVHSTGGAPQSRSEFYWIQLELNSKEDGFLNLSTGAGEDLKKRLSDFHQRVTRCPEQLCRIFTDSFWNAAAHDFGRRCLGVSLLTAFLYGLVLQKQESGAPMSEEIITSMMIIQSNIREPLSLQYLADCSGLSLSRFKARFKQETGFSPREYINQIKIREAKKMLKSGASVTQSALEMGFGSSNYFAVVFKKMTSYTPTEYIRLVK